MGTSELQPGSSSAGAQEAPESDEPVVDIDVWGIPDGWDPDDYEAFLGAEPLETVEVETYRELDWVAGAMKESAPDLGQPFQDPQTGQIYVLGHRVLGFAAA